MPASTSLSPTGFAAPFDALEPAARDALARLVPAAVPRGTVLFRPGDEPAGFVLVLSGRVDVHLVGRSGRELLLYTVEGGQTCIQTTLCLLGAQAYTGEAVAATDVRLIAVPKGLFARLVEESPAFRSLVFRAFGERLHDVVSLLERVAFVRIEARLAAELLRRAAGGDRVAGTHQELATAIGSAREVVSRRLEAFARAGLVRLDRSTVTLADRAGLERLADAAL